MSTSRRRPVDLRVARAKAPSGRSERLLEASREQVRTTDSAVPGGRRGGSTHVNTYARLAIGAAAVLVIAFVGINRLPTRNGNSSAPGMSPSPSPASSRSAATLDPSPPTSPASPPMHDAFPEPGEPVFGSDAATVGGVELTFDVASHDWDASVQGVLRGHDFDQSFGFWSPDRVNADPCDPGSGRPVGPTATDLATAIASIQGIEVSGPTEATVGGLRAVQLDVTVPADLACPEDHAIYVESGPVVELWSSDKRVSGMGHSFGPGHRILAWIVDVEGERVFIEADMSATDDAQVADEVRRIVDSIRFGEAALPMHDGIPTLSESIFGRYTATFGKVRFTFDITTHHWGASAMSEMYGGGVIRGQDFDQSFGIWSPDWVNTNPCDWESGGRVGPKADDLATAIATIPGIDVIGPTETTIGGLRAVHLDVRIPADLACQEEGGVSLWRFDDPISCAPGSVVECNHLGSGMGHEPGQRILAWIIDIDGERVFIEADMSAAGYAEVADEVRRIVDSIRFEEP